MVEFNIPDAKLFNFFRVIQAKYCTTSPYHNVSSLGTVVVPLGFTAFEPPRRPSTPLTWATHSTSGSHEGY